ncbi:hypothetical protein [Actinomadura sp. 3N508]|uniref:hypothetical protein n=1 Tax=Actinomadura sp. 3N508 TaxID=3375153 RepID=UPI003787F604
MELQRLAGNAAVTRAIQAGRGDRPAASAASAVAVQRYHVVASDAENYPAKQKKKFFGADEDLSADDRFFVRQDADQDGGFYAEKDPPTARLAYSGRVPLTVSDNADLAVEGGAQPKHFFATEEKIKESVELLKGRVKLVKTKRYLRIESEGRERRLFEVVPQTTLLENEQRGVEARTPQLCNEMAEYVTGSRNIHSASTKYWYIAGSVVDELRPGRDYASRIKRALEGNDRDAFDQLGYTISRNFQDLMAQHSGLMEEMLQQLGFNQYASAPGIGYSMTTMGYGDEAQEAAERARRTHFDYHYGAVVARSGSDFITMENYARDKNVPTQSSGDPLWYFRMYGTAQPEQSWHRQWAGSGSFRGAVVSFSVNP